MYFKGFFFFFFFHLRFFVVLKLDTKRCQESKEAQRSNCIPNKEIKEPKTWRERERERCLFHTHRQTHDFIHTVALPREELIREGKIMIYHSRKS
jgi:hypothetical protein